MKLYNYWLIKSQEANLLKVLEWSHRKKRDFKALTEDQIVEALTTYLRDSSHSY